MKNVKSLIILIASVFFLFENAQAQERRISDDEWTVIKSRSSLLNRSYRLRRFYEVFSKKDGKLLRFSDETMKFAANGDLHTITEHGSSKDNIMRNEFIKIGQTYYSLMFDGRWRESQVKVTKLSEAELSKIRESKTVTSEHFYKGKVTVNNEEFDLYETIEIETSKTSRKSTTNIYKSWFDKDGLRMKTEIKSENDFSYSTRLFEFTLDPTIKIEAPVK